MTLLLRALRRIYAALLLLMPGEVRRRHGDEMRDTSRRIMEDTLRRRGPMAAVAAGLGECADVVAAAVSLSRRAPSELRQDIAYAWRLMLSRPAFTVTIIATLAIGIGATTTVFTVVNALLLRPLPYTDPDRLVLLAGVSQRGIQISVSPRDFYDMTAAMPSIASAAAFNDEQLNLTGRGGEPERLDCAEVTWNFFDVVGAPLQAGRGFRQAEGEAGTQRVVVISHGLWQRRFGGRADVVGTSATIDGELFTIVGVAAPAMAFPGRPQIWRPLVFTNHELDASQRGARWISVVARLKPGVDVTTADAEARTVASRFAVDFSRTNRGRSASARPLQAHLVREARTGLLALFGAVALVLLTACANVANLLLARSSARSGEMTIRMALGATRSRLLRQCLAENLLMTAVASGLGLALAAWSTQTVMQFLPEALPRAEEIGIDWRVAAFAIGAAIALAVVLGTTAALGFRGAISPASRVTPAGARVIRRTLVVAEVAMALVLLVGAGLFIRSLANLHGVSPGFDPAQVLTFSVTMPEASYPEPDQVGRFVEQLRTDLTSQPGVVASAGVFGLPLTDEFGASSSFNRIGKESDPDNEPICAMRVATPDYFRAMTISLMSGRDFSARDTADAPAVAIINESAARKYWPGENPIGQSLRLHVGLTSVKQTPREIVGVVANVRYAGLDAEPQAEVYIPHAQHPVDALVIAVRTAGNPRNAIDDARAVLRRLDPNLPMASIATMDEIVAESVAARRFSLMLLVGFAGVALLLAALGIYGVLSYTVGQRTREIGVRMAMGAPRSHVLRLVVGEGMMLVIAGLAVGLGGTLAVTGIVRGLLYEVQPSDPPTLALVGAALLIVALAASYLPARRAASVNPVAALRAE
jgi:putative ABC transport system permease protein